MSMVERVRERLKTIPETRARITRGRPMISIQGIDSQRYDPELIAIEPGSLAVSRRRLNLGYGAPPVIPYAQRMNLGLRKKLLETFPTLGEFPLLKKFLEY